MPKTEEQIAAIWTQAYRDGKAEEKMLSDKLWPIEQKLNEIYEAEHIQGFKKAQWTPISYLKPGLYREQKQYEPRQRQLGKFLMMFWDPDKFFDKKFRVQENLGGGYVSRDDVPYYKGRAGVVEFLKQVLVPLGNDNEWENPMVYWKVEDQCASSHAVTSSAAQAVSQAASFAANPVDTASPSQEEQTKRGPFKQLEWDSASEHSAMGASPAHSGWSRYEELVNSSPVEEPDTQCAACWEWFCSIDVVSGSCVHSYCADCTLHLLEESFENEYKFPPRCCKQALPIDWNRSLFNDNTLEQYDLMRLKHKDNNRTYCHDPKCSAYINPVSVESLNGTCGTCQKQTCILCKRAAHRDWCVKYREASLEALVEKKGWQRCAQCGRIVEKSEGCIHMTCRCGYEFCYKCGGPWADCPCKQVIGEQFEGALIQPFIETDLDARRKATCLHEQGWFAPTLKAWECPGCIGCPGKQDLVGVLQCHICELQLCGPCRRDRFVPVEHGWD